MKDYWATIVTTRKVKRTRSSYETLLNSESNYVLNFDHACFSGSDVKCSHSWRTYVGRSLWEGHWSSFCILCGLCVRYCAEVKKKNAVGFVDCGARREIRFIPEIAAKECVSCKECFPLSPQNIVF